jgi:hypothetical protein
VRAQQLRADIERMRGRDAATTEAVAETDGSPSIRPADDVPPELTV